MYNVLDMCSYYFLLLEGYEYLLVPLFLCGFVAVCDLFFNLLQTVRHEMSL